MSPGAAAKIDQRYISNVKMQSDLESQTVTFDKVFPKASQHLPYLLSDLAHHLTTHNVHRVT